MNKKKIRKLCKEYIDLTCKLHNLEEFQYDPEHRKKFPLNLRKRQVKAMREYAQCLEERLEILGINPNELYSAAIVKANINNEYPY